MRNLSLLGLLALTLSMFSSTALAGKIEVCEQIKNDPAYQGLYGLCNAYWNETDEQAREDILAAFEEKAGPDGPPMPGLDEAFCPCWNDAKLAEAMNNGTPGYCQTTEVTGSIVEFALYSSEVYQFESDADSCFLLNPDNTFAWHVGLSAEKTKACHDDINIMIDLAFGGFICDGF